jgi:hypothetical protein
VASGGDVDVNANTLCFAANENKEWQPTNFGYSANWTGWYGKRCFFTTTAAARDAFYRRCLDWNRQLAAEIRSRQEKIKEDKLTPEIAFNEMRDLYNSTLAEALELCKNDGKRPRLIEKKDDILITLEISVFATVFIVNHVLKVLIVPKVPLITKTEF